MKVCVLGAGASGLMAAITARRNNEDVTILNNANKPGKKILMTGNGKCNITNLSMNESFYDEDCKDFVKDVLDVYSEKDTLKFFEGIGVHTYDKDGYVYPLSNQASTVLNHMLIEVERLGVKIINECIVKDIRKNTIICEDREINFDKLIIATGGVTAKKSGSDGSSYDLIKKLGHTVSNPVPVLTGVACLNKRLKDISGVRSKVVANLLYDGKLIDSESGECQFTDKGLSGICIFNLSIKIKKLIEKAEYKNIVIDLELCPEINKEDLEYLLRTSKNLGMPVADVINGYINFKLATYICKNANVNPYKDSSELTDKDIKILSDKIKHFTFKVSELINSDNAQATSGGVSLLEVDSKTMKSKINDNVYFAGEVLNVVGKCGGYNLQFAFSSGFIAGCLK
ncbi:aminoacetone oxidase family FAD-binding enzyme [Eubacterium sp.]|uniref:aminoacetone oxidase family FAD-binding enzyme n=1 Tax=Eubacterium sp. TaxID=142586 RepID=UPI0025FA5CB3|nr:aminoacetone oxidase family FAD-binding enzyme [Eubacterium sp.]MCR5628311.1 aminoacetone oxidase family FAD-binding enzyme [Eubacterium sp.]